MFVRGVLSAAPTYNYFPAAPVPPNHLAHHSLPWRSAFFNPRLYTTGTPFCVSGERADELVRAGVTMVDSGNKKGGADVRLKDAMLKAGEDFERYGLRLGAVVLISSDSDFVADLQSLLRRESSSGGSGAVPLRVVLVHGLRTFRELKALAGLNVCKASWEDLRKAARGLPAGMPRNRLPKGDA